jgi:hypothetical protein
MTTHDTTKTTAGNIPLALISRMRRRTRRLGTAVAMLALVLAAVVIFGVCACKSLR